jgi:HlyD family secretion protein
MKRPLILLFLVALAVAGWFGWQHLLQPPQRDALTLYGNVDLREVDLAFNNSQRIMSIAVQEGDHVHPGEVLARLDTSRLIPQVQVAAATLELDKANAANVALQWRRALSLWKASQGNAISAQDLDNARAAEAVAMAKVDADRAQLTLLKAQLADAVLIAPTAATVRTRLLEPGDMASPQTPVLSLSITDPKWVRVYVDETDLPLIHPGQKAWVEVDGMPGHRFAGWVGFISPEAEFTPKSVETAQLRTSLVYEVRVFVKDPHDDLRLGMPATVVVPLARARQ